MVKKDAYKWNGVIGLSCYLVCWLLLFEYDKLDNEHQGQGLFYWVCFSVFLFVNVIALAAFIRLTNNRNWNVQLPLRIIDGTFVVITILYILFWLLVWFLSSLTFGPYSF